MTRDIPAGRELDALICHEIFGHVVAPDPDAFVTPLARHGEPMIWSADGLLPVPPYSTDIAAAWLVVEKLQEQGVRVDILSDWHGHRTCRVARKSEILYDALDWSATAPLAICRAALRAVRQ